MDLPGWALTSEVRHNVFLALKEALHNVVKHARATEVRLSLQLRPDGFVLVVADNGHGFVLQPAMPENSEGGRLSAGNGLPNMRKRLQEIRGYCEWDTCPGEGTRVKLVIKIHDS